MDHNENKLEPKTDGIPETTPQIIVQRLVDDFGQATEIINIKLTMPAAGEVMVKSRYLGINASDLLFARGEYKPGEEPPYAAGLESLGEIVAVGEDTTGKVGDIVVVFVIGGAFGEFIVISEDDCYPVPSLDPAYLSLVISGSTASMAFDIKADLKKSETVLVTGAAGGTGQFAVQWAKLAGCHVIGTCSTLEKAVFLKELGCDRPVVYNEESLDKVLQEEYPKGVDVVYECIGHDVFDTALKNLAFCGRIIVIGAISSYQRPGSLREKTTNSVPIPSTILFKNADVRSFFVPYYIGERLRCEVARLSDMYVNGKLKVLIDNGKRSSVGPFVGLSMVKDAIQYMYSRRNHGKVYVEL